MSLEVADHATEAGDWNGTIVEELADGLHLALSQLSAPEELVGKTQGEDVLKFHFQLQGSASYSVDGASELNMRDMSAALVLHGKTVTKTGRIDAHRPNFAVTVICTPSLITDRLGVQAHDLPRPVGEFLQSGEAGWFGESGARTPQLAMAVRSLQSVPHQGLMRRAYLEARAVELICDFCAEMGGPISRESALDTRTMRMVAKARDYIDDNYTKKLALNALARTVGTNETKLSQAFRTCYGMTIFEYVRHRRMEEARRLLRATDQSVTEIALEVGYDHACNFTVAFKRHFGVNPRAERAKITQ